MILISKFQSPQKNSILSWSLFNEYTSELCKKGVSYLQSSPNIFMLPWRWRDWSKPSIQTLKMWQSGEWSPRQRRRFDGGKLLWLKFFYWKRLLSAGKKWNWSFFSVWWSWPCNLLLKWYQVCESRPPGGASEGRIMWSTSRMASWGEHGKESHSPPKKV